MDSQQTMLAKFPQLKQFVSGVFCDKIQILYFVGKLKISDGLGPMVKKHLAVVMSEIRTS